MVINVIVVVIDDVFVVIVFVVFCSWLLCNLFSPLLSSVLLLLKSLRMILSSCFTSFLSLMFFLFFCSWLLCYFFCCFYCCHHHCCMLILFLIVDFVIFVVIFVFIVDCFIIYFIIIVVVVDDDVIIVAVIVVDVFYRWFLCNIFLLSLSHLFLMLLCVDFIDSCRVIYFLSISSSFLLSLLFL